MSGAGPDGVLGAGFSADRDHRVTLPPAQGYGIAPPLGSEQLWHELAAGPPVAVAPVRERREVGMALSRRECSLIGWVMASRS